MDHSLQEKIGTRALRVGIIGLGYVGLPLATTFAEAGFRVTGIDTDRQKVEMANRGESYIPDIASATLQKLIDSKHICFTTDYAALDEIDAISICVPTPLRKTRDPIFPILSRPRSRSGSICVPVNLWCWKAPPTPVRPMKCCSELASSGLKVGVDFFLAFSPERIEATPNSARLTLPKSWAASPLPVRNSHKATTEQLSNRSYPSPPLAWQRWPTC